MLPEYRFTSPAAVSRRRLFSVRDFLPGAVVLVSSLGLVWPRFFLRTPSLVDDWFSISYSGRAVHALVHAHYSPATVDFAGRYRPAYTALWNYVQWHLLGPPSMATAGVWEIARIFGFLVAVALITSWVASGHASLRSPLVWLAPLALIMTPGIAVDLARYGPADPIMFAGIGIGLALCGTGLRVLLVLPRDRRNLPMGAAALTVGYLTYLLGVYAKETSICLVVLVPFVGMWLARRLPVDKRRVLFARPLSWILALLFLAPLAHIAIEVARAHLSGRTPYPVEVSPAQNSRAFAVISPLFGAPGALGTYLWIVVVIVALAVMAALIRQKSADAWLVGGVLVTGWLMTVFQLSDGQTPSRYYIPWTIAVAAVATRGLLAADRRVQIAVVVTVCAIAPVGARHALDRWIRGEEKGATAVEMAASVESAQCRLYAANFDVERRVALPRLAGFASAKPVARCAGTVGEAYAVNWVERPLPAILTTQCFPAWRRLESRDGVSLYRCARFAPRGIPDQDAASGEPEASVVQVRLPTHEPRPSVLFQAGRQPLRAPSDSRPEAEP